MKRVSVESFLASRGKKKASRKRKLVPPPPPKPTYAEKLEAAIQRAKGGAL